MNSCSEFLTNSSGRTTVSVLLFLKGLLLFFVGEWVRFRKTVLESTKISMDQKSNTDKLG